MGRILMMTGVATVLFSASAVGSWMLSGGDEPIEETAESAQPSGPNIDTLDPAGDSEQPRPLAFEAGEPPVELLLSMSASIKNREIMLQEKNRLLEKRQQQLEFVLNDLKLERESIETLQQQMSDKLGEAQKLFTDLVNQTTAEPSSLPDSGQGVEKPDELSIDPLESVNLPTMAAWLQGMTPAIAAQSLKSLCNNGQMDMAVKLMRYMEERDVSNILAAFNDEILVGELLQKYKNLPKESKN